jgi:hypothetical protein
MYQRHYRYFGRMVLDPFPPRQQNRPRNRDKEFPCRPQPSQETLARGTSRIPKEMVDDPTRDFPMYRNGHFSSLTLPYGRGSGWKAASTSTAFNPPNAKELESAYSTCLQRAWLGMKSRSQSGSGSR